MEPKGIQKSQGFVVTSNNPAFPGYPSPNVNACYGPYKNIQAAFDGCLEVFGNALAIPQGVTVGVIENGAVTEYWIKFDSKGSEYTPADFIKKEGEEPSSGFGMNIITYAEYKAIKPKEFQYYYVAQNEKDKASKKVWRIYLRAQLMGEFDANGNVTMPKFPMRFPFRFA